MKTEEEIIHYIENDSECMMNIVVGETKKDYGLRLLKSLCAELRSKFVDASQSKPQLNIEKIVSGIVDSLGDTSEGNDYHIHSVNGNRWITHNEVGSGEPLKQWLKSEIEKHIEQSKPEEKQITISDIEEILSDNLKQNAIVGCGHVDQVKLEIYGISECAKIIHSKIKPEEIEWLSEDEMNKAFAVNAGGQVVYRKLFDKAVSKLFDKAVSDLQTRIKPVDTKTVDASFWRRLEMFVSNIQVNDMAGEEEKQYIIHVIESKK